MAGRGRVPSVPVDKLARPSTRQETELKTDDVARGPDLPEMAADIETGQPYWHPRTVEWYETMRTSEVAQTFLKSDWDFLVDTALLHTAFWRGSYKHAAELRMRAAAFGITPEHRARLRLTVKSPGETRAAAQAAAHANAVATGAAVEMSDRRGRLAESPG